MNLSLSQVYDAEVAAYYRDKTSAILHRYGPGPRIHYHTGLMDGPEQFDATSADNLRRRLVAAQERMLYYAAEVWEASRTLRGDLLDVGCGLGGGAIFWAQEFGARVTAVTRVAAHLRLVDRFALQAGVRSQVRTLLCDAAEVPGQDCFDAAVAIDSSCHLARRSWFARLGWLLRFGGRIHIADCFLGRPEYEEPFNSYWHTRIGTIAEYLGAAGKAGFRVESIQDISARTEQFWSATIALTQAEISDTKRSDRAALARRRDSIQAHTRVRQGLRDKGLLYALISFSKAGNPPA